MNAPFLRAIVISAHGPTSQTPPEEITSCWKALRKSIPPRYADWPHLIAVDANGRVGDITSHSVGDHDADVQDHAGAELHDFLQETSMWLPATFTHCHEGGSGTWKHPRTTQWTRGDYVGIPQQWKNSHCLSTIVDVDLALCREDHRAPGVTVTWTADLKVELPRLHAATLDADRFAVILQDLHEETHFEPWQTTYLWCLGILICALTPIRCRRPCRTGLIENI